MATDEREAKLPGWCQQLLKDLRFRLETAREPLLKEVSELRPKVDLLKARNDALEELLRCAAKGDHMTAGDIVSVIEEYDLVLRPRE